MCGIVGYIGPNDAVPIIIDGLRRLEYRGYDSAGLAVGSNGNELQIRRAAGKLRNLEEAVRADPVEGTYGIGHTRWATHGRPTEENAHPHRSSNGDIVVVHNGIVENYLPLKAELEKEGHTVRHADRHRNHRAPDREVLHAERIRSKRRYGRRLPGCRGCSPWRRSRATTPNKIVAARSGPPAVIGIGENEYFVASDVPAILHHTRDMFFLTDGDIAVLTPRGVRVTDFDGRPGQPPGAAHLVGPGDGRKGRLQAFHAQGNL